MKDILVDDCVAVRLENPLDPKLAEFFKWLSLEGTLVVSNKLLREYGASLSKGGASNFLAALGKLQRDGRVLFFSNEELAQFKLKKKVCRNLTCGHKDWWHLRAVMLSPRKLALTRDKNFMRDVNNFPGFSALASADPDVLGYAA